MKRLLFALAMALAGSLALALASSSARAQDDVPAPTLEVGTVQLAGSSSEVRISAPGAWTLSVDGEVRERGEGEAELGLQLGSGRHQLALRAGEATVNARTTIVPSWLAPLPPLLAIALALLLRQVLLALFAGVAAGAFLATGYDPLAALLRVVDHYALHALADEDHASILLFSLLLGGMIGLITRSGGGAGLAGLVTRRATDAKRGQLAAWGLGVVVFFDDYANSLLVGSSMRPITDRLRISREKLAFLVDATAAPVASVALVSSWIGVEVGYIGEQLAERGVELDPYVAFLKTLPYRFYPWLMLFFGLVLVLTRRDFGPMRAAEERARQTGKLVADGSTPASDFSDALPDVAPRAIHAIVPIVVVVLVAFLGMIVTGREAVLAEGGELTTRAVFGSANSLKALLWASAAGGAAALITALGTGTLRLAQGLEAWLEGMKSMLLACAILVLAWSLGAICREVHTAQVVIAAIGDGLPAGLLPAAVFVVSAAVSFATGTSWGTMAILFPLVVPLADELAPGQIPILLGAISSILAGSVWGDHCSPISDTTIMSSMASSCDHVDHVRTQLPYALLVGGVALVFGEIATGFGLYPAWVGLLLGGAALFAIVLWRGEVVGDAPPGVPSVDEGGDETPPEPVDEPA
ncbi:MAG TPA: Na+/H+ antiporter NhaC family protein [Polyangiaceae bacterium LLY-WYZ-15_(1-7)]|nr:Na+/H+ antiporter NhaC family protein [Polyangiaceae bacterium LLY-WYZ-15_(1-7)]HJL11985.1 Na+/H+ antiporter NhaC family protein [Polyangiaceae bacterium LLY-WYZ-15_(1-7)]HJL21844.1 Na+/H+ antiporter NhaC family protein [Polyangiaceae bacterium LLY-WYZ-15_(1-7)]HJL36499.1 Na+/H+ antiporter NhaC family protein [Polyangiaceae bacterium LLY-WYZ-15_(1-7)]